MSTAPKELREVDMTAKMSKSKKKKLKKRAKRNQALMEETMQHIEERDELEKSGTDLKSDSLNDSTNSASDANAAVTTNGDGAKSKTTENGTETTTPETEAKKESEQLMDDTTKVDGK